jgi:catalase
MSNLTKSLSFATTLTATTGTLAIAQEAPLPEPKPQQMTNAYYSAFGDNHSRAVHAKGILVEGTFTPDPPARALTKARLFAGEQIRVLARFSDFTGIPAVRGN